MNTMKVRVHLKAISSTMELLIVASIIALVADTSWVFKDIVQNGLTLGYAAIASGLLGALIMTIVALVKHHRDVVCSNVKSLLATKLAAQRQRNKCKSRRCHQ